jgi:hypothetical protein
LRHEEHIEDWKLAMKQFLYDDGRDIVGRFQRLAGFGGT